MVRPSPSAVACTTSAEREIVKDVREKPYCIVLGFDVEIMIVTESWGKARTCGLPDGDIITVGCECFHRSDALIQPSRWAMSPED